jgi:hypothetical protein
MGCQPTRLFGFIITLIIGTEYLKRAVVIFAQIGSPLQPEIWKLTEW